MKFEESLSDKIYWHKFDKFYEAFLPVNAKNILEIGVASGDSIRYWRKKYAYAKIYGLDIVSTMPEWPKDENIFYFKLDQSDINKYQEVLLKINTPIDLLVEDGSHDPLHQKISLMESLNVLHKGSVYILEDLHTSHPSHSYYKSRLKEFNKSSKRFLNKANNVLMPLQCLLLIDHLKTNGINLETIKPQIDFTKSLFNYEEIFLLFEKIKKINFFKRNVLPDYCYSCKTNDFDFISLKCTCGVDLYAEADSMTAVLEF
jgi:hypothetical protein